MGLLRRNKYKKLVKKSEKIFLIINPVSGKLKARAALFDIVQTLSESSEFPPTVAMTEYKGHAEKLAAVAAAGGYDRVICCGGDGTLNEVINGVIKSKKKIKLGYIPAGSTNDFASGIGISLDLPTAAVKAIEGTDTELDVGSFNGERFFSYIASFGIFTASSYTAPQETKNVLGHFAYVLEGLKDLASVQSIHVKCELDGEEIEGDYVFGAIANTFKIGGIVKLSRDTVKLNDGVFEIVLVKKPENINDFNKIGASVASSNFDNDMFVFRKAEKITVTLPNNIIWSVDGEQQSTPEDGKTVISVAKRSITLTI